MTIARQPCRHPGCARPALTRGYCLRHAAANPWPAYPLCGYGHVQSPANVVRDGNGIPRCRVCVQIERERRTRNRRREAKRRQTT